MDNPGARAPLDGAKSEMTICAAPGCENRFKTWRNKKYCSGRCRAFDSKIRRISDAIDKLRRGEISAADIEPLLPTLAKVKPKPRIDKGGVNTRPAVGRPAPPPAQYPRRPFRPNAAHRRVLHYIDYWGKYTPAFTKTLDEVATIRPSDARRARELYSHGLIARKYVRGRVVYFKKEK